MKEKVMIDKFASNIDVLPTILNLFKKFGDKKCYLCDCDIDSLIIASHIHRVTDIKNDKR